MKSMFSCGSLAVRRIVVCCVGLAFLSGLIASCGGAAQSSQTTSECRDGNGQQYETGDPEEVFRKGCWRVMEDGEFVLDTSYESPETTTTTTAATTTVEEKANWVYKNSGDVFVAPFVQPVCDTLREWKAPAETTKEEFDNFSNQVAALKRMIGPPTKPTFSDTYWNILALAAEALDYERRHPNDKYPAFTLSYGPKACDLLNFTVDNSRFGIDVNDTTP